MRSPLAGWMRFPIALIAAVVGALVAVPALALVAPAPVTPVSPTEGELVDADPVLRWTESDGAGYEVRWNADGGLDGSGVLDPAVDGGRAYPGDNSHQLSGLTSATYYWQARVLPDGDWSAVATFHVDIQLDTLAPGSASDQPATGVPGVDPAAKPEVAAGGGFDLSTAVHGFVWIAASSSFAGLLLAIVGREWLRLRRQES